MIIYLRRAENEETKLKNCRDVIPQIVGGKKLTGHLQ
jgi:hypothetical protein